MKAAYDSIRIAGGDTATPLNLEKRLQFLISFMAPGVSKVLDCGCGVGEYVHALRERYQIDAWGIEYLDAKVELAKKVNPSAERIRQGDIEALPFPDATFDAVFFNEVLEHVPREEIALFEAFRVLREGGNLIVFSPNRWYPFETHGIYLKGTGRKVKPCIPLIPYIPLRIGELTFDYWARNYWQRQLRSMIRNQGFSIVHHSFLWQTFENISGDQPAFIRKSRMLLRRLANLLERTPFLRRFGVSQAIVAVKPDKTKLKTHFSD